MRLFMIGQSYSTKNSWDCILFDIAAAPLDARIIVAGKKLAKKTDYTLEYSNNTKKGTATVTIRGKGQYGGSRTVKFKITSRIFKWF